MKILFLCCIRNGKYILEQLTLSLVKPCHNAKIVLFSQYKRGGKPWVYLASSPGTPMWFSVRKLWRQHTLSCGNWKKVSSVQNKNQIEDRIAKQQWFTLHDTVTQWYWFPFFYHIWQNKDLKFFLFLLPMILLQTQPYQLVSIVSHFFHLYLSFKRGWFNNRISGK